MIASDIRCPAIIRNRFGAIVRCGKKLGDHLDGSYETRCPRCKIRVRIVHLEGAPVLEGVLST